MRRSGADWQTHLGGGTDINKAIAYCEEFIPDPGKAIFFLITDLFEGGNQAQLIRRLKDMVESGVRVICLLALSDSGIPTFDARSEGHLFPPGWTCCERFENSDEAGIAEGSCRHELLLEVEQRAFGVEDAQVIGDAVAVTLTGE